MLAGVAAAGATATGATAAADGAATASFAGVASAAAAGTALALAAGDGSPGLTPSAESVASAAASACLVMTMMLMRRLIGSRGLALSNSTEEDSPTTRATLSGARPPPRAHAARHWRGRPTGPSCCSRPAPRTGVVSVWPDRLMRLGTRIQIRCQLVQDLTGVVLELGAAEIEHRPVLRIHDLDAQPLGRDVEQQLILERLERLALVDRLAQLRHQRLELLVLGRLPATCARLLPRRCGALSWCRVGPHGVRAACRGRWTAASRNGAHRGRRPG